MINRCLCRDKTSNNNSQKIILFRKSLNYIGLGVKRLVFGSFCGFPFGLGVLLFFHFFVWCYAIIIVLLDLIAFSMEVTYQKKKSELQ